MIIKYKKKSLNSTLFIGVGWVLFSIVSSIFNPDNAWMKVGYAGFAVLYLIWYFYKKNAGYGIVNDEFVKVNGAFKKPILLEDLIEIKEFAGDIIFKSATREIAFSTEVMEETSLANLKSYVQRIKAERNL